MILQLLNMNILFKARVAILASALCFSTHSGVLQDIYVEQFPYFSDEI